METAPIHNETVNVYSHDGEWFTAGLFSIAYDLKKAGKLADVDAMLSAVEHELASIRLSYEQWKKEAGQ